ncbi:MULTISPECIES: GNAT family N-acetyltransferase [unclassified Streptomyces]|uniref:GNAT family N-acetyltransferase n=1 Tax=unclassified Streptomyces TaxID=2593676 RepID=UPI002E330F23|nr:MULTISPECIES: GNAT family N-acetyltransferase [unclassified Streptomyces]
MTVDPTGGPPLLLFPGDPLRPRRPDPHFAAEAATARSAGAACAVLDHEALLAGDAEGALARVPRGAGPVWYRGRPLPAARHAALAAALTARGGRPLTSPAAYRTAHELPGWYAAFRALTQPSGWLACAPGRVPEPAALARLAAPLGVPGRPCPLLVKDWGSSGRHEEEESFRLPDAADTDRLVSVVGRFLAVRGVRLTGGVVLRAVEPFDPVGRARVWWVDGEPVLTGPHPGTPELRPVPDLTSVAPAVRACGPRFVTTDLARRTDGVWRVVEVGDGQVSALPPGVDHRPLFEALVTAGAGHPLMLAAGRVALRALLPATAARVADGEAAGFDWIDGTPAETTSGAAGMAVRAAAAGPCRPGWGVFVLTDAVAGTALGSIGFHGPPDDEGFVEIGYDLSPSARGAGWATEAVRLLAGWAAARPEVRTVCALTEPENVPSRRVLERAGFRFVGEREGLRAYEARAAPDAAGAVDGERLNAGSRPRS